MTTPSHRDVAAFAAKAKTAIERNAALEVKLQEQLAMLRDLTQITLQRLADVDRQNALYNEIVDRAVELGLLFNPEAPE